MNNLAGDIVAVGCGRMGQGIALSFAMAGRRIALVDAKERTAEEYRQLVATAERNISEDLRFLTEIGVLSADQLEKARRNIAFFSRDAASAVLREAPVVMEAVPEILSAKQQAFTWLNEQVSRHAVIASTTSTILVDSLSVFVNNSARFLNAHWLNPAHLMPLVEIGVGKDTAPGTVDSLKSLLESIGKFPVVCKASPGYIVPRIQALAMNEAARLYEEGVASAEEIDRAVRIGFGIRFAVLGLLEFIDWGGGDILYHGANHLAKTVNRERYSPPEIVKQNMESHRRGLQDGIGFVDYSNTDIAAYRKERLTTFVGLLQHMKLMPRILDRP